MWTPPDVAYGGRRVARVPKAPLLLPAKRKRAPKDQILAYTWVKYMKTGDETGRGTFDDQGRGSRDG